MEFSQEILTYTFLILLHDIGRRGLYGLVLLAQKKKTSPKLQTLMSPGMLTELSCTGIVMLAYMIYPFFLLRYVPEN